MNIDEAEDILEEITRGGLPSNVKAEIVPDHVEHAEASAAAASDAAPSILDELVEHAEASAAAAPAIAAIKAPERPALCGAQFTQNGRTFPDFCSLPAGHHMRSPTANHYAGTIGWFA